MKRLFLSLATAILVASPLMTVSANAQPRADAPRHFDGHHDNGYYLGKKWYWGEPKESYYARKDFRIDHRDWAKGGRIPHDYPVTVIDYNQYHLRRPPHGYRWVRVDNNFVLEAIATGVILDLLTAR